MKKIILPGLLVVILVSGCVSSGFTGTTITGNEIVFASDKDTTGNELYLMDPDGTNIRRLTFNEFDDNNPAFSFDKKRIAFHRATNLADYKSYEIFIIDLETGKETQVTDNEYPDSHPDWSPDGNKLVFVRFVDVSTADIFVKDLETEEEFQLTDNLYDDNDPEWSPDGTKIAFKSTRNTKTSGKEEIFVMNANGSDVRRLTNVTGWVSDHNPSWSFDSEYIYFERYEKGVVPWHKMQDTYFFITNWQDLVPWNIYMVDLEGNHERVTDCDFICWLPVQYNGGKVIYLNDNFLFLNETLMGISVDYATIMPDGSGDELLLNEDEYAYKKAYFDF